MTLKVFKFPDGVEPKLYAFSDALFATEEEYHSRSGRVTFLNEGTIDLAFEENSASLQGVPTKQNACYWVTVHELMWIWDFLAELGTVVEAQTIFCDNMEVVLSVNGMRENPDKNNHVGVKEKHASEKMRKNRRRDS